MANHKYLSHTAVNAEPDHTVMVEVTAPVAWVEDVSRLRLPKRSDHRLQELMDRNNEGTLAAQEREELESLVELSERLSLVRAEALRLLGRQPG
ncbi:MAG: hypothetical protein KF861_13640 [Planctomycetaceae bacterium]|nr:hypothetical protein [Planctomycetaceae bacterium]